MSGAPLSQDSIDKIAGQKKISTLAQKTLGIMPPESDTEVDRRYFLFGEGSKEVLPLFETAIRQAGQIKWSDLEDYISDTPPSLNTSKKDPTIKEILESNPSDHVVDILIDALEDKLIKETASIDFSQQDAQNILIQFFISLNIA